MSNFFNNLTRTGLTGLEQFAAESPFEAQRRANAAAVIREELEAMATRIKGTVTTDPKTGKRRVKPKQSPPIFKRAKEEKANRMIKRLRANREAKK